MGWPVKQIKGWSCWWGWRSRHGLLFQLLQQWRMMRSTIIIVRCRYHGSVEIYVIIIIIIILIFHSNLSDLTNNLIAPSPHRLTIIRAIHPHCQAPLLMIGTGNYGAFESKVVASWQREGMLDICQCRLCLLNCMIKRDR